MQDQGKPLVATTPPRNAEIFAEDQKPLSDGGIITLGKRLALTQPDSAKPTKRTKRQSDESIKFEYASFARLDPQQNPESALFENPRSQ